jgi:hypothetical protein
MGPDDMWDAYRRGDFEPSEDDQASREQEHWENDPAYSDLYGGPPPRHQFADPDQFPFDPSTVGPPEDPIPDAVPDYQDLHHGSRTAGNPRDRAWDAYASGRDRGDAEHGAYDLDQANWEDNQYPEPFNAGGNDPGSEYYPDPDTHPDYSGDPMDEIAQSRMYQKYMQDPTNMFHGSRLGFNHHAGQHR